MVTKLGFIFASTLFFLFVVQVGGMIGQNVLTGFDTDFTAPSAPTGIDTVLFGFISNFGVFISLMSVSSEFFLFGSVVIGAYVIAMLYIAIEVIRGI